jgi:hypothetical protein
MSNIKRWAGILVCAAGLFAAGCGSSNSHAIAPVQIGLSDTTGATSSAAPTTGGGGDPASQDAKAKADARTAETAVETCFTSTQTYQGCDNDSALGSPGIALGTGPGQVEIRPAGASGYAIISRSQSGDSFMIAKGANGAVARTCTPTNPAGACHGGTW